MTLTIKPIHVVTTALILALVTIVMLQADQLREIRTKLAIANGELSVYHQLR